MHCHAECGRIALSQDLSRDMLGGESTNPLFDSTPLVNLCTISESARKRLESSHSLPFLASPCDTAWGGGLARHKAVAILHERLLALEEVRAWAPGGGRAVQLSDRPSEKRAARTKCDREYI